tara:strand:+ start:21 stop:140 length:120 start_codon:yes stop_codon:yes gene_type:complete
VAQKVAVVVILVNPEVMQGMAVQGAVKVVAVVAMPELLV